MGADRWTDPPPDFQYLHFERIAPVLNEYRYYYLAWQPTLWGPSVVRVWGRRGGQQQVRAAPFGSLDEAWPEIRKHIRARLRHGYRIVGPEEYSSETLAQ
jgi:predicted DNA-binding WGR domain protein